MTHPYASPLYPFFPKRLFQFTSSPQDNVVPRWNLFSFLSWVIFFWDNYLPFVPFPAKFPPPMWAIAPFFFLGTIVVLSTGTVILYLDSSPHYTSRQYALDHPFFPLVRKSSSACVFFHGRFFPISQRAVHSGSPLAAVEEYLEVPLDPIFPS